VYPNCAGFHKNPNGSSVGNAVPVDPIALRDGDGFSNKNGTAASPCAKLVTENKFKKAKQMRNDEVFIRIISTSLFIKLLRVIRFSNYKHK
jgi:hypothetical protein